MNNDKIRNNNLSTIIEDVEQYVRERIEIYKNNSEDQDRIVGNILEKDP